MENDVVENAPKSPYLPRDSALPLLLTRPLEFRNRYRWALVWLLIGASCDLFTTLWNVRQFGPEIEVHIVQRWLSHWFGVERCADRQDVPACLRPARRRVVATLVQVDPTAVRHAVFLRVDQQLLSAVLT